MAKIGNWGNYLKFSVSEDQVLTFTNFKRKTKVRTSVHNMAGGKPKLEYLGKDLDDITLSVYLDASLGVRPRKTEEKLLKKLGAVAPLVIGGKKVCGRAMLVSISSAYDVVLRRGEIYSMKMDLTFKEYN